MISRSLATAAFVAALFTNVSTAVFAEDKSSISTQLQVTLQRHIERSLVEGAFMRLNYDSGELQKLFPTKAHALIMQGDGFFVLCADLRNESGEEYDADYYVVQSTRGFKVIRTEIENRAPLKKLIKAGKVKKY